MSAAEIEIKEEQFLDFKKDLFKQFDRIEWLTAGTPYSINEMKVDFDIWKDLKKEWEEPEFWHNFKEIAPLIFCCAVEQDEEVSDIRDKCVSAEIRKTKAILKYLYKKISTLDAKSINMHHFSTSLKTLQEKINVIKALKAPPMDPSNLKIPIFGTNKNLVLNIPMLHEAIRFEEIPSESSKEEDIKKPQNKPKPKLDFEIPAEDHKYLAEKLKGFRVHQTEAGLLEKETMIKLLKTIGEFAKNKNLDMANDAQNNRLQYYGRDDNSYVDIIRQTVRKEEMDYNYCTKSVLHKLYIPQEVFIKSEQILFSDPFAEYELLKDNIDDSLSKIQLSENLDKETIVEIIKKANDVAFSKYKELHYDIVKTDPTLTPIVITCLSHDYILDVYGYDEQTFKAAIQQFKAFDDPELSVYIQKKQMELMQM